MLRGVGQRGQRADADAALGQGFDAVHIRDAGDVQDLPRLGDADPCPVEQFSAAGEHHRIGRLCESDGIGPRGRLGIAEVAHQAFSLATASTAAAICG